MLVLARKSGETIRIGDDIVVRIQRITGGRVTVAIAAPRERRILRGELVGRPKAPSNVGSPPAPVVTNPGSTLVSS